MASQRKDGGNGYLGNAVGRIAYHVTDSNSRLFTVGYVYIVVPCGGNADKSEFFCRCKISPVKLYLIDYDHLAIGDSFGNKLGGGVCMYFCLTNAVKGRQIEIISKRTDILQNHFNVWGPSGICIIIAVLGFNFIGDGLRDALDPKQRR